MGRSKRLLFLGGVGSAKSSTADKLVGADPFDGLFESSGSSASCTQYVQKETREITLVNGEKQTREVIDTPGVPDVKDSPEQQRKAVDELLQNYLKNPEEPIDLVILTVESGSRFQDHHKINYTAAGSILKGENVKNILTLMTKHDMSESDAKKRLVASGAKTEEEYRERRRDEWSNSISKECPGVFSDEALKIIRDNIGFVSNFSSAGNGQPGADDWEKLDSSIEEARPTDHEDAAKHDSILPHEELKKKEEEAAKNAEAAEDAEKQAKKKDEEAAKSAKEAEDAQKEATQKAEEARMAEEDFPKEFSNDHERRMEKANWLSVSGRVLAGGKVFATVRAERNAIEGANRWECILVLIRQDGTPITALHLNPGTAGGQWDVSTSSVQQKTFQFQISREDAMEMKKSEDGGVHFYYDKREGPGMAAQFTQIFDDIGEVKAAAVKSVT